MPEVRIPEEAKKLGETALATALEHAGVLHWSKMKELVEKADLEFIGGGSECVVVGGPDKGKVIKVDYRTTSPEAMKGYFYRQRILEAMFPHNFPHFMAAGVFKNTEFGVTVAERVYRKRGEVRYPFGEVMAAVTNLGLPIFMETDAFNFAVGKDGGEYYIDRLEGGAGDWDMAAISKYMQERHAPADRVRIVEKSIERLRELGED